MKIRICTKDDYAELTEVIKPVKTIYGVDTISTGWQDRHFQFLETALENPYINVVAATTDDNKMLGFCVQSFFDTPRWSLSLCYISESPDKNQFNASKIGGPLLDKLIELAETRGKYEFYYAVRDSGRKRLDMTLSSASIANAYVIRDIEVLPPFTPSKYEKVAEILLGHINGKNAKTIVIRHAYRNEQHNQVQP
jgi:hypothetical protein